MKGLRILVISDSHGSARAIQRTIEEQPEAKHIFFLGDGIREAEECRMFYSDRIFHLVSGNCDFSSIEPSSKFDTVCGTGIFYTHGHLQNVKYTLDNLLDAAKEFNAKIALYGHTHCSYCGYIDNIYIVNPGSLSRGRDTGNSYAVIDITDQGILPAIIKI